MTAAAPSRWLWTPRHSPWRWLLAGATALAALAHVPEIGPHLRQAPYMGEEFIVLTAACLLLAVAALVCDSAAAYALTALTCGPAIVGYVATRVIAFPELQDDVGNWLEPLGVVSILAESTAFSPRSSRCGPRRGPYHGGFGDRDGVLLTVVSSPICR